MNWKTTSEQPPKYGWYVVAVLPVNHSGSKSYDKTGLAGDNSWRERFGFTIAWYNNTRQEWWDRRLRKDSFIGDNITHLVTHWDYPPKVPILEKSHVYNFNYIGDKIKDVDELKSKAKQYFRLRNSRGLVSNEEDFCAGFIEAVNLIYDIIAPPHD